MKELKIFRKFLAEGQINENLGTKLAEFLKAELTMLNPGEGNYEITKKYIPQFEKATSDEDAKAILDQFAEEMAEEAGTLKGDITAAYMDNLNETI